MREWGRQGRWPLALSTLALLAACTGGLEARREALCRRAVPAIVPAGATARLLRVGTGPRGDSVRVDYRLIGETQRVAKARWIVCGFGPGADLETVTTESGPLGGAAVYLLRHYYVDTPEARAADPAGSNQ